MEKILKVVKLGMFITGVAITAVKAIKSKKNATVESVEEDIKESNEEVTKESTEKVSVISIIKDSFSHMSLKEKVILSVGTVAYIGSIALHIYVTRYFKRNGYKNILDLIRSRV